MTDRIDVTVAALIEQDDRFLLVEERANGNVVFNQPAGHLEPGETLTAAVTREVEEETGFAFQATELLGFYLWHCEAANTTFLRLAFCGDATPPADTPTLDDGIIATHWLTREQWAAKQAKLRSPLVLRCVDDYLAGTRYPLSSLAELQLDQTARLAIP